MDRRQLKTKNAILEAFTILVNKKDFNKITINDIIQLADISRSTFYAHFSYKEEIMETICHDLFNHISKNQFAKESGHDFTNKTLNADTIITHLLYHIKENANLLVSLIKGESRNLFLVYFQQYLEEIVRKFIIPHLKFNYFDMDKDLITNHICISFIGLTEWWIKQGFSISPEDMKDNYLKLLKI